MEQFTQVVSDVNSFLNGIVWGWPALILLSFVGVLMTCLTKFFQISHIGHWIKMTVGAMFSDKHVTGHTKDKSISQFQSLCTALAATVGTGNIVGVAGAIMVGGPGAVFWMWLIAFFGMMTNFSENVLGIYYRRKNSAGEWSGGAMYYLRDGLGSKKHCKTIGKVRHRQYDSGKFHLRQHVLRVRRSYLGDRYRDTDSGRSGDRGRT